MLVRASQVAGLNLSVVTLEEIHYGLSWRPIAATALVHRLTLVTRDEDDFGGCGLRVLIPFA